MRRERRKIALGDLFALKLSKGTAILQVVGQYRRTKNWVVRVLDDCPLFDLPSEQIDFTRISEKFTVVLTSLETAERDGAVSFLRNASVPPEFESGVPLFKANVSFRRDGSGRKAPDQWWLDDGTKVWRVGTLEKRYRSIPDRTLLPTSVLRDRIEQGWNPLWQFDESMPEFSNPRSTVVQLEAEVRPSRFYLILNDRAMMAALLTEIEAQLPHALVSVRADDDDSTMVTISFVDLVELTEIERIETIIDSIATRYNAQYDGNEIPIDG